MPHGNKRARNNKKKKGGKGNNARPRGPINPKSPVSSAATTGDAFNAFSEWASIGGGAGGPAKPLDHYSSIYSRYKKATMRFKQTLEELVPPEIYKEGNTEHLMDSADYLANDENTVLDSTFMQDLRLTLRVRKRVAKSHAGGDEGHSFFILVLEYCWKTLCVKWKQQKGVSDLNEEEEEKETNRFGALCIADEIEDDEDDEEDLPDDISSKDIARPKTDETKLQKLTFKDMLRGDDRMAAILFLNDVDAIMGINVKQYSSLKNKFKENQASGAPEEIIITKIMEAAFASNFAIQQVSMLEHVLAAEHTHLNTIYRIMAVVAVPDVVQFIIQILRAKSPMVSKFDTRKEAVQFVGDCLETGFRDFTDPHNRLKTIVPDFCSRWKILSFKEEMERTLNALRLYVRLEAPVHEEKKLSEDYAHLRKRNTWLSNWEYIGGDRNIIKTLRLVQVYSNVIMNTGASEFATMGHDPGQFGLEWSEKKALAKSHSQDFDHFLLIQVMPVLVAMCRKGLLSKGMPRDIELIPVFQHIKSWCKNPHLPVSLTLAFCFQQMVTSIFDVQGEEQYVNLIGSTAKRCWDKYFEQLDWAKGMSETTEKTLNRRSWTKYLDSMATMTSLCLPRIGLSCVEHIGEERLFHTTWNPMCAGTFLLYMSYFNNLENGSRMIDTFAQCRFVLHFYNGLIQTNILKVGELPFLDFIHSRFTGCRGIWGAGAIPQHGDVTKHFLVSAGYNTQHAETKSKEIRACLLGENYAIYKGSLSNFKKGQKQERAEEISKSFRRLCLHDFHEDKECIIEKQQKSKNDNGVDEMFVYTIRVEETIQAMREDERLLATNLVSVGEYMNGFLPLMFQELEWEQLVIDVAREMTKELGWREDDNVERYAELLVLGRRILGILDFIEDPLSKKEMVASIVSFKRYFSKVPYDKIMWFNPAEEEAVTGVASIPVSGNSGQDEEDGDSKKPAAKLAAAATASSVENSKDLDRKAPAVDEPAQATIASEEKKEDTKERKEEAAELTNPATNNIEIT